MFRRFISISGVAAAICLGFVGASSAVPASAEDAGGVTVATAGILNGYEIANLTGERLVLKDKRQGRRVCEDYDLPLSCYGPYTFGKGFGAEPPEFIEDGHLAYFEIPAFATSDETLDSTEILYETATSHKQIRLFAGVDDFWFQGVPSFIDDLSRVKVDGKIIDSEPSVTPSTGIGSPTKFWLTPSLLP